MIIGFGGGLEGANIGRGPGDSKLAPRAKKDSQGPAKGCGREGDTGAKVSLKKRADLQEGERRLQGNPEPISVAPGWSLVPMWVYFKFLKYKNKLTLS